MLRRNTPLRRTPLKRKFYRIPKVSKSPVRKLRQKLYEEAVAELRVEVASAQQGVPDPVVELLHCQWPGCVGRPPDVHHTHGRTGTNLYDKKKLKFVCRRHHTLIHHDPKAARAKGFMQ